LQGAGQTPGMSQPHRKAAARGRHRCSPLSPRSSGPGGFTLLELLAVVIIISVLASIAVAKYLQVLHHADVANENTTIANLQASIETHWVETLLRGEKPSYPQNPFSALKKLPAHYRLEQTVPDGTESWRHVWVFVPYIPASIEKLKISLLKSENAPALLKDATGLYKPESVTRIDGLIFHQRRDDHVFFWIYDRARGVISDRYRLPRS
jgi:prepilin-type N-terminal cleavage/methylation domain-containing protein